MHIVADTYVVLNEISKCRFGSVHLATHIKNRHVVTIKFIPTNVVKCFDKPDILEKLNKQKNGNIDKVLGKLPSEFVFGSICQSPEIITYNACYVDQGCWAMVMEFPEGFSILRDYIISHGPLDYRSTCRLVKQLATALNTCVVNGVDHRDLSPDNILYDPETKQIKLVGFGHAASLSSSKEPYKAPKQCTNLPPEAVKYGVCSPLQTIVWKFGCVIHYCRVGAGRLSRLSCNKTSALPSTSKEDPVDFLIRRCLDEDPRTRILYSNLQKHINQNI